MCASAVPNLASLTAARIPDCSLQEHACNLAHCEVAAILHLLELEQCSMNTAYNEPSSWHADSDVGGGYPQT